jgi:putative aldouronate transport system substrate-binding protein
MKRTRGLAVLLVLLLCFSLANFGTAVAQTSPEEYRITLFVESTNVASSDETVIGKIVKDKFNIAFDYEVMTGDWNEFVNLKLASGDFPELAFLRWDFVGSNWVSGGGAIPLDDLFADKTNFQTLNADRLPLWRMEDPTDTNTLYKWTVEGGLSEDMGARLDMLVRSDVLEALGYPKLKSMSDWIAFLKEAKEKFPTDFAGNNTIGLCVPLAEPWGAAMVNICAEKATYSGAVLGPALYNFETGKFEDYLTVPAVKENYQFFNTLYREGLLDAEVFTTTGTEIAAKMNTAQPIAVFYATWLNSANANLADTGHEEASYICMPLQTDSQVQNDETRYLATWQGYGTYAYTMTPATRYPERLAELIDWASSEEGLSLLNWGIEGTHWTWVDGVKTPTDSFMAMAQEGGAEYYQQGVGIWGHLGIPNGYSPYDNAPVHYNYAPIFTTSTYNDTIKKTLAAYGYTLEEQFWNTNTYVKSAKANITVQQAAATLDPDSEEARISEQVIQLRNNYISDLIRAESDEAFDATWAKFVEAHNALNPQKLIDYVNAREEILMAEYNAN